MQYFSGRLAISALAAVGALMLAGCGGSKSSSSVTAPAIALTAGPKTFTAFGNAVNAVTITGGAGPFSVRSSDANTIAVPAQVTGATLLITPKNVLVNTIVTLTFTDAANATSAVTVTVVPATIATPLMTVTNATGSVCARENNPANTVATLCAAEMASASIMLKDANGAALANRDVLFEVLTFGGTVAPKPDSSVFARLTTVTTDASGKATVAFKADVEATSEASFLRATDVVSTHRIDSWINVLKQTNGASDLSVVPGTGGFTAYYTNECPLVWRDYGIHGGTAPYAVTLPAGNTLVLNDGTTSAAPGAGIIVATAGARFTVQSAEATTCANSSTQITVTDALGVVAKPFFTIAAGGSTRPTSTADLTVSPPNISMTADPISTYCSSSNTRYAITGGTGPYRASSSIPQIFAAVNSTNGIDVKFTSDSKWRMLKGQIASLLVLDAAGKVATATMSCN